MRDKPCAPSIIPKNPIAAVVARSPGYMEAKMGKPFSGKSGEVLKHLLKENGTDVRQVLLTNVVLCAPDEGKVPPEAIKACAPRLKAELETSGTDLIIAAGSEAVNLLVGRGAIDRYRGYRIERDGKVYIATNNPALVLRDDSTFPNLRKDFKRAFHPIPEPTLPVVEVIQNDRDAVEYIHRLPDGFVAIDTESRGGLTHRADIVCIQFSVDGSHAAVIGERECILTRRSEIFRALDKRIRSGGIRGIYHNGKWDTKLLVGHGVEAAVDECTMLMSYACDERSGQTEKWHGGYHKLEYLLSEEFGWPDYEPASVKQFKKTGIVSDYDELYEYAGRDAGGTYRLFELLSERIRVEGTEQAYRHLLLEGSEACREIELTGFHFNVEAALDMMEDEVAPELHRLTVELQSIIDNPIYNPRSPQQNAKVLYDDWRVYHEMRSRPDMDRSCDISALNEIIAGRWTNRAGIEEGTQEHWNVVQFAITLKRFRQLSKQADTYIIGLSEKAINDPEHKVYTDLLLHGTTSGRLSSRNPNLQNITRTKPDLPDIRSLFLPSSPGRVIVQADYSQAELRCIAHFSQDRELLRIYEEDLDLHDVAAQNFYGEKFTKENRSRAKNMNFGVAYGQSAATFQEKHDIPEREAEKFIEWWWSYFTGVRDWKSEIIAEMRTGAVTSPFGRKRRFYLLTKENLNACIREAVNFKPQSTAGDFTLRSVIVLEREIDPKRAAIVITVHDNIVGDVEERYADEYKMICEQIMISRPKDELGWTIPFKIDISVGPSWGEAK